MDKFALARAVKELARRTDACWRPPGLIQHQFAGSPFGTAYVCISPSEQGDHASANHNRTLICGAEGGLTGEGIAGLRALFETAGVGRFFVWLSPGADLKSVRRWLTIPPPRRPARPDREADRQGGGARLQDDRFGDLVDPRRFTGQPAKRRLRSDL